jgi:hypothetical protein
MERASPSRGPRNGRPRGVRMVSRTSLPSQADVLGPGAAGSEENWFCSQPQTVIPLRTLPSTSCSDSGHVSRRALRLRGARLPRTLCYRVLVRVQHTRGPIQRFCPPKAHFVKPLSWADPSQLGALQCTKRHRLYVHPPAHRRPYPAFLSPKGKLSHFSLGTLYVSWVPSHAQET